MKAQNTDKLGTRAVLLGGSLAALALAGIVCVACSSSGSSDGASHDAPSVTAPDASSGLDGSPSTTPEKPSCPLDRASAVRGKIMLFKSDGQAPPPLAGVHACIHGRTDLPCATTADDGTYELACAPEGDVGVIFSKEGYASTLWLRVLTAGIGQELDTVLVTDTENAKLFATVGVTYPRPGYGLVTLNDARDTSGITVKALNANGVDGPFYSAHGTEVDRDAGATIGEGVIFMVAPVGSLKIEINGPNPDAGGSVCIQTLGGWGSGDGTITVPVVENTETSVLIRCP